MMNLKQQTHKYQQPVNYRLSTTLHKQCLLLKVQADHQKHKISYVKKLSSSYLSQHIPKAFHKINLLSKHLEDNINHEFDIQSQTILIKFPLGRNTQIVVEIQMNLQASSLIEQIQLLQQEVRQLKNRNQHINQFSDNNIFDNNFPLLYPESIAQEIQQDAHHKSLTIRKGKYLISALLSAKLGNIVFQVYFANATIVQCFRIKYPEYRNLQYNQSSITQQHIHNIFKNPENILILHQYDRPTMSLCIKEDNEIVLEIKLTKVSFVSFQKKFLLWLDLLRAQTKQQFEHLSIKVNKYHKELANNNSYLPSSVIFQDRLIQMEKNVLKYIGQEDKEIAQIIGTTPLKTNHHYSCKVIKARQSNICFGITAVQNKTGKIQPIQDTTIFYDQYNQNIYGNGKVPLKKIQKQLKEGDIITMKVDLQKGTVTWTINGQYAAQQNLQALRDPELVWTAYIEMCVQGDEIEFLQ